jgi:two-component system sensor histidine kinase RegB
VDTPPPDLTLRWLVRLRWWAVVAQAGVLSAAVLGLGIDLPVPALAAVVGALGLSNLALSRLRGPPRLLVPATLLADLVALTVLLALTGGPTNPFTVLYIVHVALAAVVLSPAWTWGMAAAAVACFGVLFLLDPPDTELVHDPEAMRGHLVGMWVGFAAAGVAIAGVVARLAADLRARDEELSRAREDGARAARLASLSTLAAGAAHEMGSPLTTIAVAAAELEDTAGPALRDDLALIRRETERCRAILARMSAEAGVHPGETLTPVVMSDTLERVRARFGDDAGRIFADADPSAVVHAPAAAVERALAGLVDNALRAAPAPVRVEAVVRGAHVTLAVHDSGPGIPSDILGKIGEPFFTTRPPGQGMGLGVFLARRLAEELGGTFQLASAPGRTTATLTLPRSPR